VPAADAVLEADARAGIDSGPSTRRDDDSRTLMAEDQWSFCTGQGCGLVGMTIGPFRYSSMSVPQIPQ